MGVTRHLLEVHLLSESGETDKYFSLEELVTLTTNWNRRSPNRRPVTNSFRARLVRALCCTWGQALTGNSSWACGPSFGSLSSRLGSPNSWSMKAITTSEIKFSVLIDAAYTELAVRTLHSLYGLDKA